MVRSLLSSRKDDRVVRRMEQQTRQSFVGNVTPDAVITRCERPDPRKAGSRCN